jgi:hypothetical protein
MPRASPKNFNVGVLANLVACKDKAGILRKFKEIMKVKMLTREDVRGLIECCCPNEDDPDPNDVRDFYQMLLNEPDNLLNTYGYLLSTE